MIQACISHFILFKATILKYCTGEIGSCKITTAYIAFKYFSLF